MIPLKDSLFFDWVNNFGTLIETMAASVGISSSQVTTYDGLHATYVTARSAASAPGTRSKTLLAARNDAARNLLDFARVLYIIAQNHPGTTDAQREELGIKIVKKTKTPENPPTAVGQIEVVFIRGRTVRVRIKNSESTNGRRLPAPAIGFNLFSATGASAPTGATGWTFQGSTGTELLADVTFEDDVAAGTQVWFGGMFFNRRKETGPPSIPVTTFLSGGASEYQA